MVSWISEVDAEGTSEEMRCWSGVSDAGDWNAVRKDLAEFWSKVCERFVLPHAATEPWSVILCMFYPDAGNVNAQASNLPFIRRIDRENVDLSFTFIERLWYALPEDAGAFNVEHEQLTSKFFSALQDALATKTASQLMLNLLNVNSCEVYRVTYDDVEKTAVKMQLLIE